jgi:hypothetical protein
MPNQHLGRLAVTINSCTAILAAACMSALAGMALAQAQSPGEIDASCVSYCTARGYGQDFCSRACAVQQPSTEIPANAEFDWQCVTVCRNRGGQLLDCLTPCRRR